MHQHHSPRRLALAEGKPYQPCLVRMRGIPFECHYLRTYLITHLIQLDPCRPVRATARLDHRTRRTSGLVAHEHHLMPRILEHGLEVIDDPSTRAHAIAGDNDGGSAGALEVVDHLLVLGMGIDADQLAETQWLAAFAQALPGFGVPVVVQFAVGLGHALGQGGVEDDGELGPIQRVGTGLFFIAQQRLAVEDVFQLVEQLLCSAQAECWDEDGALVRKGAVDGGFQALLALAAVWVQAVAVGTFEHQDVSAFGWLQRT